MVQSTLSTFSANQTFPISPDFKRVLLFAPLPTFLSTFSHSHWKICRWNWVKEKCSFNQDRCKKRSSLSPFNYCLSSQLTPSGCTFIVDFVDPALSRLSFLGSVSVRGSLIVKCENSQTGRMYCSSTHFESQFTTLLSLNSPKSSKYVGNM